MFRKFGMPNRRYASGEGLQFLHLGSTAGPCGHSTEVSSYPPLSRPGDFHHERARGEQAAAIHQMEEHPEFLSPNRDEIRIFNRWCSPRGGLHLVILGRETDALCFFPV